MRPFFRHRWGSGDLSPLIVLILFIVAVFALEYSFYYAGSIEENPIENWENDVGNGSYMPENETVQQNRPWWEALWAVFQALIPSQLTSFASMIATLWDLMTFNIVGFPDLGIVRFFIAAPIWFALGYVIIKILRGGG